VSATRRYRAARTPQQPIAVSIVCRSELLLIGLERLLSQEPDLEVFTYSKPPTEGEPALRPPKGAPGRRVGPRVVVLSDRGGADIGADCRLALESLGDQVVLLSSRPDVSDLLTAMGAGTRCFVTEVEGPEVLLASIRAAARHRTYMSQQDLELVVEWLAEKEQPGVVRDRRRENELLRLLAEGRSTNEIARSLGIAPKTVRNRVSKLYRRLGVHSRAAAVRLAEERGMLDPTDRRGS
jgi:DNA-binding NarL/FixJ family response regulator